MKAEAKGLYLYHL